MKIDVQKWLKKPTWRMRWYMKTVSTWILTLLIITSLQNCSSDTPQKPNTDDRGKTPETEVGTQKYNVNRDKITVLDSKESWNIILDNSTWELYITSFPIEDKKIERKVKVNSPEYNKILSEYSKIIEGACPDNVKKITPKNLQWSNKNEEEDKVILVNGQKMTLKVALEKYGRGIIGGTLHLEGINEIHITPTKTEYYTPKIIPPHDTSSTVLETGIRIDNKTGEFYIIDIKERNQRRLLNPENQQDKKLLNKLIEKHYDKIKKNWKNKRWPLNKAMKSLSEDSFETFQHDIKRTKKIMQNPAYRLLEEATWEKLFDYKHTQKR